jgi:hypothetical protein
MAAPKIQPAVIETEAEREARIEREAVVIAAGQAELDAGQGIPLEALKSWLTHRRTARDTPLPAPAPLSQRR